MQVRAGEPRLLLVDDHLEVRTALRALLCEAGYAVTEATDGVDALETLRAGPLPRAILLDLRMPRMNGWEFCVHREEDPHLARVPLILLSADGSTAQWRRLLRAQAAFTKPADVGQLLETLHQLCDNGDRTLQDWRLIEEPAPPGLLAA